LNETLVTTRIVKYVFLTELQKRGLIKPNSSLTPTDPTDEDPEELIQDATCIAAKLLHNAEKVNKQVTPDNIEYYTRERGEAPVEPFAGGEAPLERRPTGVIF
jgi:hypothetical protein